MRGKNQRPRQEGKGSQTTSYAVYVVHTLPRDAIFFLFSCPGKISQQSHSYTLICSQRCCRSGSRGPGVSSLLEF